MKPYYEDEWAVLYHGDCLELADMWTCADVLVTDPPYGIRYEQKVGAYRPAGRKQDQVRIKDAIANDGTIDARDAALAAWGTSRAAIVFGSWRMPRPAGTTQRLIWHKAGSTPGPVRAPFLSNDEEVYIIGSGFRASSPPLRSVITTHEMRSGSAGASATIGHPTPKPLDLMEKLIDRCPPGTVADPFAGSGSTGVAAKALGRKAILVELEERFCEIAARRLSQDVLDFTEAKK